MITFVCAYIFHRSEHRCTHGCILVFSENLLEHGDAEVEQWWASVQNLATILETHLSERGQEELPLEKVISLRIVTLTFEDANPVRQESRPNNLAQLTSYSESNTVQDAVPKAKALNFGTSAELDWDVLVAEREAHETEEATSAITYRYK